MQTKQQATLEPGENAATENLDLNEAIRNYVRTYALWHGRAQASRRFGVSRHTMWRFLERGHMGRSLPRAVTSAVGGNPQAIDAAAEYLIFTVRQERKLLREMDYALVLT